MIRLFAGKLSIHIIIFPVLALMCYLTGTMNVMAFVASLFLHETAHAIAASALGLNVGAVEVMPFGCAARIESFGYVNGAKEILVAAAGPAANILAASGAILLGEYTAPAFAEALFRSNIMLAAVNLLPALPLDGGRILTAVLGLAIPFRKALKISCALGIIAATVMLGFGVILIVKSMFNPTLFIMGGFLMYSSIKFMRNATFEYMRGTTQKRSTVLKRGTVDVKNIAAYREKRMGEVIGSLDTNKYNIVHVLDNDLSVIDSVDEGRLMEGVLKYGMSANMEKIAKKNKSGAIDHREK